MAFDFPAAPAIGDVFPPAPNGLYEWNGTVWKVIVAAAAAGGIYVSDTAPPAPIANALWWDSNEGGLYLNYLDPGGAPAQWIEVNAPPPPPNNSFMTWPAGVKVDYFGATAPAGTRWCDGASYAQATYPALFAAIGLTYGGTAPNFLVPDMRGRASAGKDNMGGTAAGRITVASGVDGTVLGAAGGAERHTLGATEMPSHQHPPDATAPGGYSIAHIGASSATTGNTAQNDGSSIRVQSGYATGFTGGGLPHLNIQPMLICNTLITTGGVV